MHNKIYNSNSCNFLFTEVHNPNVMFAYHCHLNLMDQQPIANLNRTGVSKAKQ